MKRSDSMAAGLISMCPNSTVSDEQNPMYSRDFQTMLEGFDEEESGHVSEKKRRLGLDQVKALEKNFEVENKLEPERKVKLAQELGLQPRQVAVWFQNRRARWKTKQLERDYGLLKANYDGLKINFEKLQSDNQSLLKQIGELKSKLDEDGKSEEEPKLERPVEKSGEEDATELKNVEILEVASVFGDFKDGSSDSDSSAILNEDNNSSSPMAAAAISSINEEIPHHKFFNGSSSSSSIFQFSEENRAAAVYQPQFVKIEEHNFLEKNRAQLSFLMIKHPPSIGTTLINGADDDDDDDDQQS